MYNKKIIHFLLISSLFLGFSTITKAQSFGCNSGMYISQTNTLYSIVTTTNPFTYPQIGTASATNFNAIGLNPVDGFIYGLYVSTNELFRINATGTRTTLGATTGLPAGVYNSAEIDDVGNYYVKINQLGNEIYRINLTTRVATRILLNASINVPDLAFNNVTKFLYGVNSATGQLVSIDPSNGTVQFIGIQPGFANFGGMFGSSTGEIYGINNLGGFYQFDLATGQRVLISDAPASSANDAAHCVTAPITFSADLSVSKTDGVTTYTPGTTTTYTIVARNNGPFGVLNATVTDAVPSGIPSANVSYTATVAGDATTSVVGTQTGAISDQISLPVGATVDYTVTVTIPILFTGNLTNTVTIATPTNISDPNLSNNTATDTDTSLACFKPAVVDGNTYPTTHGITALKRAGNDNSNWPMIRQSAWTILEAKSKGFVINRILTTALVNAIPNPVEGMMVFDLQADCLKININGTSAGWRCFNTPACP